MDTSQLIECLKEAEGSKQFAYTDSLGYITVGIGRCLDRRKGKGLSPEEQLYLLNNDIEDCKHDLQPFPWYQQLDDVRKCVMIELCFNLGIAGLLKFKNMIAAIQSKSWQKAVDELLDSTWSSQIQESRKQNITYRLLNGAYPS